MTRSCLELYGGCIRCKGDGDGQNGDSKDVDALLATDRMDRMGWSHQNEIVF